MDQPIVQKNGFKRLKCYSGFPDISPKHGWVSASKIKNYMINDPVLDYFDLSHGRVSMTSEGGNGGFVNFVMNQGIEFEKKVWEYISQKVTSADMRPYFYDRKGCFFNTQKSINDGIEVIYQGFLYDEKTQTFGYPDFIIKKGAMKKLFLDFECEQSQVDDYVILDAKFMTINLKADHLHMCNAGHMAFYKGQLYIYSIGLSNILKKPVTEAYIIGRKYNASSKHYRSEAFDTAGKIDYQNNDSEIVTRTLLAIKWYQDLLLYGWDWQVDFSKPEKLDSEFFPNMSNSMDYPWSNKKMELAKDIGDITLLWMCGPKHRIVAHENGIFSIRDPDICAKKIGINGKIIGPIVDRIIKVNTSSIMPVLVTIPSSPIILNEPLFIDFEFVGEIFEGFETFPSPNVNNKIFMIGVFSARDGYKCFISNSLENFDIEKNIQNFSDHVNSFNNPTLVHWSHVEYTEYKKIVPSINPAWSWCDLLKLLKDKYEFAVRGCYDFKLKNIVKSMDSLGLINCKWPNGVADGIDASFMAYSYYKNGKFPQSNMNKITEYNRIDCESMSHVWNFLQKMT